MQTSYRPISKRRLSELQGYVAWSTTALRMVAFLGTVGISALLLRSAQGLLPSQLQHDAWWVLPSILLGGALYFRAGRWTRGRGFRKAVRLDLARGVAAAHRIITVDAIEVEEQEDEGPADFVLTSSGETVLFSGQYLDRFKRKGFPWREFEILEAPESRIFFGLVPLGEQLVSSARRPPFTWDEYKRLAPGKGDYNIVDVDFEALRAGRITTRCT